VLKAAIKSRLYARCADCAAREVRDMRRFVFVFKSAVVAALLMAATAATALADGWPPN